MKRLLTFCLLTLCIPSLWAQAPNAWIKFTQQYFRIPVAKDGIHKLSYDQLQQAGFPTGVDPTLIQLFHRGQECAIDIAGAEDGQFNASDVILFYGQKNDGTLDRQLYRNPSHQINKYYNIFSDTTNYFLTIGTAAGKRMQRHSESNTENLSPQPYHFDQKLMVLWEQYAFGDNQNNEIFNSEFNEGEGWASTAILASHPRTFTITDIRNTNTAGPLPKLELMLVGHNNRVHPVEIFVGPSLRLLKSLTISPFENFLLEEELQWSDIAADGTLSIFIKPTTTALNHAVAIAYIKLDYAQTMDAQNATEKVFTVPAANTVNGYLEIQNAPSGVALFDITNPGDVQIIEGTASGAFNAVYPSATSARKFLLSQVETIPAKIIPQRFRQIDPSSHDYIIITHPMLRKPAGSYSDPVKAYADYRASEAGGGYDTLLMNVQEVIDQFNYGERSSLAIFNFMEYLSKPRPPKYLFIVGKGFELRYNYNRHVHGGWDFHDLIPPGGHPASDLVYSTGLRSSSYIPTVATGRIAATYPRHVANYLDKIKEKEQSKVDDLWHKKILHLSGGTEEGEPELFRSILENFETVAEGPYIGAEVTAIAKKSRDLEVVNISEQVNSGLSLMTFFGHSSTSVLDIEIGNVTDPAFDYHNSGKYPMLLMNGCQIGAFFIYDTLIGENWTYARNRGASAFIAHNSYGLISSLRQYSRHFYDVAFADSSYVGRGIGDIQKEAVKRYIHENSITPASISHSQQMMLLGDPAVPLFGTRKVDLDIKPSQISGVSFNNAKISVLSDSFAIKLVLRNFGIASRDTFRIEVKRTLPDNSQRLYDSLFIVPNNTDTVLFVIREGVHRLGGTHTFHITLDADDIIKEGNEENNLASYSLFIPSNGTKNLYPSNFAIVKSAGLNLSWQTSDLTPVERDFLLELDTISSFDSPFIKRFTIKGTVLASLQIDLPKTDTLAYYWRTRLKDPSPDENANWETSSFTFIQDSDDGWAQVHFPQFLNDVATGIVLDEDVRRIDFQKSITPVEITTYGSAAGKSPGDVSVKIKGAEYNLYSYVWGSWGCQNNTFNLIAFDKNSAAPYIGVFLKWYEQGARRLSCGREPFVINSFMYNEVSNGGNRDIIQYVNNVALGDSVVMYNIGNPAIDQWPVDAKQKLGELGVSVAQLDGILPGEPFVIFGRKGSASGSAKIYRAQSGVTTEAELKVLNETISGGFDKGFLASTLIGPAQAWNKLVFNVAERELQDTVRVEVKGIKMNGESSILRESAITNLDLSSVDAGEYPYLQLVFHSADTSLLTSPQFKKWIVLYTPVPEGILLTERVDETIDIQEGQSWSLPLRFVNISERNFSDSLSVKTTFFNQPASEGTDYTTRIKSPEPFDTTRFSVTHHSKGFAGLNDVQVTVNPRIEPEQYYDNNIISFSSLVNVKQEFSPPVLDVTFDGKHIYNGDFVSDNPLIEIQMWDENRFMLKEDTLGMQVHLTSPCAAPPCESKRVWFSRPDVLWTSATADQNYTVQFQPELNIPGQYMLSVEAQDVSGNAAEPFTISFELSNVDKLDLVQLYPNPILRDATFGFLSSHSLPSKLQLIVYDLAGRVLFEKLITEGFSVGKNLFTWNGKDQNGNELKGGLYLYYLSAAHPNGEVRHQGKIILSR